MGWLCNFWTTLVHCISFPPGRGIVLCYWSLHNWLWWLLCQAVLLGLVDITWALHLCHHYSVFWGKPRGLCPACSRCYYWPVRSLCSFVHNISYLVWTVTLSCKLLVTWPVWPPCCFKGFSPAVGVVDSSLPVLVPPSEPLITQRSPLIIWSPILINELVIFSRVYCLLLWFGGVASTMVDYCSSLLISLTMAFIISIKLLDYLLWQLNWYLSMV